MSSKQAKKGIELTDQRNSGLFVLTEHSVKGSFAESVDHTLEVALQQDMSNLADNTQLATQTLEFT